LLYLGSQSGDVRLIITNETPPKGPYMTLSHRWSSLKYKKLDSSTMTQLRRAVDVIRLPPVFQDAIKIARHLGIHHLWIDSLCIMQDENNRLDWIKESKMMGRVYASASLNISATSSFDGRGGLLGKSSWASRVPSQIELDFEGLPRKYLLIDGELWEDEVDNGPLNNRGWVFQERYLARRVAHFGESQLAWECRERRALEVFPDGLPPSLGVPNQKHECNVAMAEAPSHSNKLQDVEFAKDWQKLLRDYSGCELTFPRDKLMAIEGIATHIMTARPGDAYLAGVWESSALYDLPWHRDQDDCDLFPLTETYGRAPSWSWASVDGDISFPLADSVLSQVHGCYAEVKGLISHDTAINNDVNTMGTIQVAGTCLPLHIRCSADNDIVGFDLPGFHFSSTDDPLESTIYFECAKVVAQSLSRSGKLLFMPLFSMTQAIYGIVLHKVHGPGEHRRIGAIEISLMANMRGTWSERQERNTLKRRAQLEAVMTLDGSERIAEIWNRPAVMFMLYLEKRKPPLRTINIS
jgi:hypothetical protein